MQFIRIIGRLNSKERVSAEPFWLGSDNPEGNFWEEIFFF